MYVRETPNIVKMSGGVGLGFGVVNVVKKDNHPIAIPALGLVGVVCGVLWPVGLVKIVGENIVKVWDGMSPPFSSEVSPALK